MKELDKNNVTISLNILSAGKDKYISLLCSKNNSNPENQVIFLMIPNRKGNPYLAVKKYQHYEEEQ